MAVFESPFYNHRPDKDRWASALEAISKGLAQVAVMHEKRESDESAQKHEDARDAARNAFTENLARFQSGEENARLDKTIEGENAREQSRTTTASEDRRLAREQHDSDHADQMEIEKARLALEGRRTAADEARMSKAERDASSHEARDEENARKNRAMEAQRASESTLKSQMQQRDDLMKIVGKPENQYTDPTAFKQAKEDLKALDHDISNTRNDIAELSKAAGFETSASKEVIGGEAAKLAPDRQQLFKDLQAQFPGKSASELLQRAKDAPQETVDQVMTMRPGSKPSASTDAAGATDFMPQSDKGAANVAQATDQNDVLNAAEAPGADEKTMQTLNTGSAQLADSGAAAVAAPAPDDQSVADAGPAPTTTTDQEDQNQQFSQFQQQLEQSPEGQGVHTTLDRLAQSDNSVQADKLRRQAELQLGDLGDDTVDPSSYIDWYLQQQQQEPGYA